MVNKIKTKFCVRYRDKNGDILLKYLYRDISSIVPFMVLIAVVIIVIYQIITYVGYYNVENYKPFYELFAMIFWAIVLILSIFVIDIISKKIGNVKISSCDIIKNKNNKIKDGENNEL